MDRVVRKARPALAAAALWVALLTLSCTESVPGPHVRDCRLHISHSGGVDVRVVGDIQGRLVREGDVWRGALEVAPGRVKYALEVDGDRVLDEGNPLSLRAQGREWSVYEAPDCTQPDLVLTARTLAPAFEWTFVRVEAAAELAHASATVDGAQVTLDVEDDRIRFDASGLPRGKHQFTLTATDDAGRSVTLTSPFWVEDKPFRWADAQIYQVVLDRIAGTADTIGERHGGRLQDVTDRIESGDFAELGINVLWLSPLAPTPDGLWTGVEGGPPRYSGYHGYWPIASRTLDPRWGTEADLEALLSAAHSRGMRVLVDVVPNHVHAEHPYVAEHPAWFDARHCVCGTASCPWWSHIETCWFTPYLPDINWSEPAALDAQVEDALWWIDRFGFDGLRVDAVPMMPRFVTRHLTDRVHRRFEQLRARHLLLGENFTGPGQQDQIRWYLGPDGLDSAFDFPLMWALREVFAWEQQPLWHLADVWRNSAEAWSGSTAVMATMVGNHDVSRFVSEAAGHDVGRPWTAPPPQPEGGTPYARLWLAQAFVLTAPGAPVLYYGDEFGLAGANDPDNRRPMPGSTNPAQDRLREQTARVGRLRACLPALRRGELQVLRADAERLAYLRSGDQPAIIVLSREPTDGTIALSWDAPRAMVEVFTGAPVNATATGLAPISAPPYTVRVLIPAGSPCFE